MKPSLAVLGTGRMGSALVAAFLKQGYKTHIWNRTAAKCEPLAALGARIAATPQDAVANAEIIIVNVADYAVADDILRPDVMAKTLRGKLLVQLTSGSPGQARSAAAWAGAHGVDYLDGAIMATPDFIGKPEGTVLYSGASALFDINKPVLLALGGNAQHVGDDPGRASALDAALLMQMWGALFGALQGVAICAAESIPLAAYEIYLQAFKPVTDGAVVDVLSRIGAGRLAADETSLATIDTHYGAFRQLLELCRERGLDRTMPHAFDQFFQAAIKAGRGQDDFAALATFVERAS